VGILPALLSRASLLFSPLLGWFGLGGIKLWLILLLLSSGLGGYGGFKLTSNYYLAKEARQYRLEMVNQEKHRREVESLLRKQEELERLVDELAEQAEKDPNAKRPAIGINGVRRINQVR